MQERQPTPMRELTRYQALRSEPPSLWYGPRQVSTRRPRDGAEQRAVGLAWFSIGLGLAQVMAPDALMRMIGGRDTPLSRMTMRTMGIREIASGVGILMQPRPAAPVFARLAGDLIDLVLLGEQFTLRKRDRTRLSIATAAVLGVTLADAKTAMDLTRARRGEDLEQGSIHVKQSITVNAPREQVYAYWRDLENLPKFMAHLESVKVHNGRSMWRAHAPAGRTVEWEAEVTIDRPNSMIAWSSTTNASIPNRGSVRFETAPGDRGTEVHVELFYDPPGGALGALFARLFGEEPTQQIKSDLRRFKQVIETGEVVHSDSSIHPSMHAARPAGDEEHLSHRIQPQYTLGRAHNP